MNEIPKRTGATQLSDAELLLFDFLFRWRVRRQALTHELYSIHMNCCYSHGLREQELDDTLRSLADRKLIHPRKSDNPPELCYTLTADGGRLWELERQPDWEAYIDAQQNFKGTRQSVLALKETIARQYMGGLFASGQIVPNGRFRVRRIERCKLLPWRVFESVTVVRIPIQKEDSICLANWHVYEACRCWWRDVHELDTLNGRIR